MQNWGYHGVSTKFFRPEVSEIFAVESFCVFEKKLVSEFFMQKRMYHVFSRFFGLTVLKVFVIKILWSLRKERPQTLPKESELNCRAVATLLKAVSCFIQLSRGRKLVNRYV